MVMYFKVRGASYFPEVNQRGIFIHIPKVAGTSICRALGNYAPRMILQHGTASFVRQILGENEWKRFFSFAFVRNPWERHVSWYLYCKKEFGVTCNFTQYIEQNITLIVPVMSIDVITSGYWSQQLYVEQDGKQVVDFVGRFEHLKEDFEYVCSQLGVKAELTHSNKSPEYNYREFYTDKTAEILADRCKWEINKFGYKF